MYFFVTTSYENGLKLWFYCDQKKRVVKFSAFDKTHTSYLITNDIGKAELKQDDNRIVSINPVVRYDALKHKDRDMWQVLVKNPNQIWNAKTKSGLRGELSYSREDAVRYNLRYVYDTGLFFGLPYDIQGNEEIGYTPVPLFGENILKDVKFKRELKKKFGELFSKTISAPVFDPNRVAIDIETYQLPQEEGKQKNIYLSADEAKHPVMAVSLCGDHIKEVHAYTAPKDWADHVDTDPKDREKDLFIIEGPIETEEREIDGVRYILYIYTDESQMMEAVFEQIVKYPFILTYNGDEYDLLYLHHRAWRLGIQSPFIVNYDGYRHDIRLPDGIHLDILKFFFAGSLIYVFPKGTFFSNTLEFTAQKILGKGKKDPGNFEKFTKQLADYNFYDAELTYEFTTVDDNLILNMIILISRAYNRPLDEVCRESLIKLNTSMFDYVHIKANYLIPSEIDFEEINNSVQIASGKGARYKGAIIEAKPGVTFNCKNYDFASLYPSAIDRWHLSYENFNCEHEECRTNNMVPEAEYWVCKKEPGIVSCWFGALKDVRVIFKNLAKNDVYTKIQKVFYKAVAQALKIVLLSGYGLFGAYGKTKYYLLPLANSITATSRYSIRVAIDMSNEMGLPVVYVHTDGIIIQDRDELCLVLKDKIEKRLDIDFDLDHEYRYVIISKKANYLGIHPDGTTNITGLMGKKRNICLFFRQTFDEIIDELAKAMNVEEVEVAKNNIMTLVAGKVERLKNRDFNLGELVFEVMLKMDPHKGGFSDQTYNVARYSIKKGINKKAGDFVYKVLTVGSYSAKPLAFTRMSEINVIKYEQLLESTLSQLFIPLEISFKAIKAEKYVKLDAVEDVEFLQFEDIPENKGIDLEFDSKKRSNDLEKWR
jgi:DNA polymerase I